MRIGRLRAELVKFRSRTMASRLMKPFRAELYGSALWNAVELARSLMILGEPEWRVGRRRAELSLWSKHLQVVVDAGFGPWLQPMRRDRIVVYLSLLIGEPAGARLLG